MTNRSLGEFEQLVLLAILRRCQLDFARRSAFPGVAERELAVPALLFP